MRAEAHSQSRFDHAADHQNQPAGTGDGGDFEGLDHAALDQLDVDRLGEAVPYDAKSVIGRPAGFVGGHRHPGFPRQVSEPLPIFSGHGLFEQSRLDSGEAKFPEQDKDLFGRIAGIGVQDQMVMSVASWF